MNDKYPGEVVGLQRLRLCVSNGALTGEASLVICLVTPRGER
jgi:hypothetical protein